MAKLQLYYPVKPYYVGQKFGETANQPYYQANGVIFKGHNGLDLAALHGEEVRASHDGIVEVQVDSKQGHGVVIRTLDTFEYNGGNVYFKTIYWHLIDNIPVKTGDIVKAGDLVGYADSTGLSTGDHLHFSAKPMGKATDGSYYNLEDGNGYYGCIDPTPYFNGKYAQDLVADTYIFSVDMSYQDVSEEVRQLQRKLQRLGYFPRDRAVTNFYGDITRAAVFTFQNEWIELTWLQKLYRGKYCAQKTRAALNRL